MKMSRADLREYNRRTGKGSEHLEALDKPQETEQKKTPGKLSPGTTAKGIMNKTEALCYNQILLPLQVDGEIGEIRYEKEKFRVGIPASFYEPDFTAPITNTARTAQRLIIEVKGGFIRDKSITKFKAAAMEFREYNFQLWQWKLGEGWRLVHDLNPGVKPGDK